MSKRIRKTEEQSQTDTAPEATAEAPARKGLHDGLMAPLGFPPAMAWHRLTALEKRIELWRRAQGLPHIAPAEAAPAKAA